MKIGIIGGGTFGCIIGKALQKEGCKITIFDCKKIVAASRASGFLMKPSWFDGLGKKITDPSLELLDSLYGLQKIKFRVGLVKTYAYRLDREKVLDDSKLTFVNEKIKDLKKFQSEYNFDKVIVTAGIWSGELVGGIEGLTGKKGISFEWKEQIKRGVISPWAPYKQVVAFNVPGRNLVWGGDGSAILSENWSEDREEQCLERVSKVVKLNKNSATRYVGVRPYMEGVKPCYLEKKGEDVIVVTGGAKNGTVAAGWAAWKLVKML